MTRSNTRPFETPRRLWQSSKKLRFLVVGGWNTLFGYLCFYVLYLLAADRLHYLVIAFIAHFVAVIHSYVMQRRLVFFSNVPVLSEFLRFNASLIGTLLFGLLAMYLLVEAVALSPLVAQASVMLASVILSYALHSRLSFRAAPDRAPPPS